MSSKQWIQSFSGRRVEPLHLKPEMVCIEDIAHALSMKCRFTGHCHRFYSVAEHSVRGSILIEQPLRLAFLLHEISEAYLPDVAGPIKSSVRFTVQGYECSWGEMEQQHAHVTLEALGLADLEPLLYDTRVRVMDLRMLVTEARDLLGEPPDDWKIGYPPFEEYSLKYTWNPAQAERAFLAEYQTLKVGYL